MMKLAFIGMGKLGFALANHLQSKGHQIIIAHDDPNRESVRSAQAKNPAFAVRSIQAAIDEAEVIFLAIPNRLNEEVLTPLDFRGKVLVDCTNPIGAGMSHGLGSSISGAEKVQSWAKNSRVVKAYSIYGFENVVNTDFPSQDVKPAMLIAGDDLAAKDQVRSLNTDLGFATLDTGNLSQSLHLEHMTLLWVKMVRRDGHNPHFTWAFLER